MQGWILVFPQKEKSLYTHKEVWISWRNPLFTLLTQWSTELVTVADLLSIINWNVKKKTNLNIFATDKPAATKCSLKAGWKALTVRTTNYSGSTCDENASISDKTRSLRATDPLTLRVLWLSPQGRERERLFMGQTLGNEQEEMHPPLACHPPALF